MSGTALQTTERPLNGEVMEREAAPDPKDELEYALSLLHSMVLQNCRTNTKGEYFSGWISLHAEVMRYLCDKGLLELVSDGWGGRAVTSRDKPDPPVAGILEK